jgi:hypothetical protein
LDFFVLSFFDDLEHQATSSYSSLSFPHLLNSFVCLKLHFFNPLQLHLFELLQLEQLKFILARGHFGLEHVTFHIQSVFL